MIENGDKKKRTWSVHTNETGTLSLGQLDKAILIQYAVLEQYGPLS